MTDREHMDISALRYALGRESYIVGITCDYIVEHIEEYCSECLRIMAKDIDEEICCGDNWDTFDFVNLRKAIENETQRRITNDSDA